MFYYLAERSETDNRKKFLLMHPKFLNIDLVYKLNPVQITFLFQNARKKKLNVFTSVSNVKRY